MASIIHEGKEAAALVLREKRDAAAAQAAASQLQLQEIAQLRQQLQGAQQQLRASHAQLEESQVRICTGRLGCHRHAFKADDNEASEQE